MQSEANHVYQHGRTKTYLTPVVIPKYQEIDKLSPVVQRDSNSQINQLLRPADIVTMPEVSITQPNGKTEILQKTDHEK